MTDKSVALDETYRAIGMRVVELARSPESLDFAAKSPKSGRKSHNCKPGKSHGCNRADGTQYCISLSRKCQSPATGNAKKAADYVAKKGGALTRTGSQKIQKVGGGGGDGDTPPGKDSQPQSVVSQIDQKYGSEDPTPEAIDGWLRDRLDYHVSPEGLATQALMEKHGVTPGNLSWGETSDAVKGIEDKDSFIKGMIQREQEYHAKTKDYVKSWRSFSFFTTTEIEKMEKTIANPRTSEATKAKLRKKLDNDRETSQGAYDRHIKRYNTPVDERRKQLEKEFDDMVAEITPASAELKKKIQAGNKRTIQSKTEEFLRRYDAYRDPDDDIIDRSTQDRHRAIAKEYLSTQAIATPPLTVLGLDDGATATEIKAAYRKLASKWHPDKGGSADDFNKLNSAYNKLRTQLSFGEYLDLGEAIVEFAIR